MRKGELLEKGGNMRFALYGMPCAGKTTLLENMKLLTVVNGSVRLNALASSRFGRGFRELGEEDRRALRECLAQELKREDNIIVDGHYAFGDQVVFTNSDGDCYDVFLYLYESPGILLERMGRSGKNTKYLKFDIEKWQAQEIDDLRRYCLNHEKDFYIIDDRRLFEPFIREILQGFSTIRFSKDAAGSIAKCCPGTEPLYLLDGDKTVSSCDVSRTFLRYNTHVFDGNFYTGFQFWRQNREFVEMGDVHVAPVDVPLNLPLLDQVNLEKSVLLTCGHPTIWNAIAARLNIPLCISGPEMSADAKFHIVQSLRGLFPRRAIITHGDSLSDWFMLEATGGTLWIKNRMSRSLVSRSLQGLSLKYIPWILAEEEHSAEVAALCAASKSDSGVSGNVLADVHERLGEWLGTVLSRYCDASQTTMLCLLRGGLFLSRGIYRRFNCRFLLFNPRTDSLEDLDISTDNVLIVDSVVNTGATVLHMIDALPGKNIIVAAGVIQRETVKKLCSYPIYVGRVSENKFTGARCKVQKGAVGPDTSDRLFNLI